MKELAGRMRDGGDPGENDAESRASTRKLHLFGREFPLPRSRPLRIVIGILLVLGGLLGFLPVLGFWMIPLGFLILSFESHPLRRLRRRIVVKTNKRTKKDS